MTIDERLIFLEGKHVRLKVPSKDDVITSDWMMWLNSAENSAFNQHHYFPVTVDAQEEFAASCNSSTKIQLGIVERDSEDDLCGMVSLNGISLIHRHAEISGLQDQQRTAGKPAIFLESWALMLRHGFEELGLESVYGGTFRPHVAEALGRIFNFEVEGVRRRHVFKSGRFHDVTLIAVHRDTITYPDF